MAFAGAANAAVQQGDTELYALGGWMTQNFEGTGSADLWFLWAGVNYFMTDNISVGGTALFASIDVGDGSSDIWGLGVAGRYHFMPTNQWVPYVGGQLLWVDFDVDDGWLWGPVLGVRYELNRNVDAFAEYQYHRWQGGISDGLDDGHGIFLGLIHQFK